jgi:protocatechuate 3,4-dioxygenase beta subunit
MIGIASPFLGRNDVQEISMDNDDQRAGRILTRREALKLLGLGCAALLAPRPGSGSWNSITASALACVARPELSIGPFFVDGQLNRSDIRFDPHESDPKPGIPLTLRITVFDVTQKSCVPLSGAQVDVWHCDWMGIYSGIADGAFNTLGQKFLRGYQITDTRGRVQFLTVYPGWYSGRTVHIHFMIRTRTPSNQPYEFTSQFFFDDRLTDIVHGLEPYSKREKRNTRNQDDVIYRHGGNQLLLDLISGAGGYIGRIRIGLDLSNQKAGQPDRLPPREGRPPS